MRSRQLQSLESNDLDVRRNKFSLLLVASLDVSESCLVPHRNIVIPLTTFDDTETYIVNIHILASPRGGVVP
jgi:hypothetical protein